MIGQAKKRSLLVLSCETYIHSHTDAYFVPRNNTEAHNNSFENAGSYEITSLTAGTQYNIRVEGSLDGGTAAAISTQTVATSKFSVMNI